MMRQSGLLKWAQINKNNNKGTANRNWIHPPDALQRGHIAYLVKFLGCTDVDQAKGIDVVKEGIRKLKFSQQLKRAEGTKTPKVELTISMDGVAIQEPKTKVRWPVKIQESGKLTISTSPAPDCDPQKILHQYPLHHISYCADDKSDKKFFSFIAKEADSEKHTCFVFVSDKLAEEITLTIGQAFDLAYRRFLETSGRDLEIRKQLVVLQKKVQTLELENSTLKQRIVELQSLKDKNDVDKYKKDNNIGDLLHVNGEVAGNHQSDSFHNVKLSPGIIQPPPPVPPRSTERKDGTSSQELISEMTAPVVGTKLENLVLDDLDNDFDPRSENGATSLTNGMNNNYHNTTNNNLFPLLNPPPAVNGSRNPCSPEINASTEKDLFGANPFNPMAVTKPASTTSGLGAFATNPAVDSGDPFGMGNFSGAAIENSKDVDTSFLDKRFSEMLDGFSRGLSFGNDDFSLESLDPLHKSN